MQRGSSCFLENANSGGVPLERPSRCWHLGCGTPSPRRLVRPCCSLLLDGPGKLLFAPHFLIVFIPWPLINFFAGGVRVHFGSVRFLLYFIVGYFHFL